MKIRRKTVSSNGDVTPVEKIVEFDVKPGWKRGNRVTFRQWEWRERMIGRLGDETPGHIPADIVFVLEEKPHAVYVREENDLVCTREISLREALCGFRFEYEHLDGRRINVMIPAVITPESEQRYPGLGMPISKNAGEFGDLVFRFRIRFPKMMSNEHKAIIRNLTFLDD